MLYLFLCSTVAKQIYCIWQTKRVRSNCKASDVSLMFFRPRCLGPLNSFLYFLSHSPPLLFHPLQLSSRSVSSHPVLALLALSPSLSLLPMSFNSIKDQGPTPLPLHPHLLSVFFSRWCNSAVRCRGHHKLTRSLITVDLMSGKERGREWGAARETLRKTETESSSSYLPGDMAEWMRGGTNSSSGRTHHHHHKR